MMMEETVKVEYDNVYPPLNKPCNETNEIECSNKNRTNLNIPALCVGNKPKNNKNIFISSFDRRYKDNDPGFETKLRTLGTKLGVDMNATISNKGDLTISLKKKNNTVDIEEAKFHITEALTHQIYKNFKVNEKIIKKFADKRYQERICKNLSVTVKVDFNKSCVMVEGGPQSVKKVVSEIESYLNWNTDLETLEMHVKSWYYDFIRGVYSDNLKEIIRMSGKYVDIRFESESKHSVILSGNKNCVQKASEIIKNQIETIKKYKHATYDLNITRRAHVLDKFKNKTFEEYGVSLVILQKADKNYICHIFGEEGKFKVVNEIIKEICERIKYKRIDCPYWICKFLLYYGDIGKSVFNNNPDIKLAILPLLKCLEISSSESDIDEAVNKMTNIIGDIRASTHFKTFYPDEVLMKHLEERNAYRIKEIEAKTATIVCYELPDPASLEVGSEIYIIGEKNQIDEAEKLLEEYRKFINSFKVIEMEIPFYLHKYIIGSKGRNLKEIIEKHGKHCTASFSKDNILPDRCIIKGPESEISKFIEALENKCTELKQIHKIYKAELSDNNLHSIFMNDKKNMLAHISEFGQIEYIDYCEEEPKVFKCIGKKEIIDKVKEYVEAKIREYSRSVTREIFISDKMIPYYSNFSEEIIKVISDKVGSGIFIKLPKSITTKDKISLHGPVNAVDSAITIIKALSTCNHKQYYMEMMKIPQTHTTHFKNTIFKSLGPNGVTVFCHLSPKNEETSILIVGENSEVKRVKADILKEINILQNTVEKTFNIKSEYKKEFLKKKKDEATLVQRLSAENGNVRINIGDKFSNNNELIPITLKGHKEYVEKLEIVIKDLVKKFEQRIEKTCDFKRKDLYSILSINKFILKNTMEMYNVVLSVSDNYYRDNKELIDDNETCYIRIKGFPNDVQNAFECIKKWKFVTISIDVPKSTQQVILSKQNAYFNTLYYTYGVQLDFESDISTKPDQVTISGIEKNVNDAIVYLKGICDENYEVCIYVPNKYYTRLIGKQGSNIKKFNFDNNVKVYFPDSNSDDMNVTIYGNKTNCLSAAAKIQAQVDEWESSVIQEFSFDSRAKQKLFSTDPTLLRKIMTQFKTNIRFLPVESKNQDLRTVSVSGSLQNVKNCITYLQDLIDSTMEEIDEEYMYHPPRNDAYIFDVSTLTSLVFPNSTTSNTTTNHQSPRSTIPNTTIPNNTTTIIPPVDVPQQQE